MLTDHAAMMGWELRLAWLVELLYCQDTEADETSDTKVQTQGDLLNQQKLLRSTEQRHHHPATRARSDCSSLVA